MCDVEKTYFPSSRPSQTPVSANHKFDLAATVLNRFKCISGLCNKKKVLGIPFNDLLPIKFETKHLKSKSNNKKVQIPT